MERKSFAYEGGISPTPVAGNGQVLVQDRGIGLTPSISMFANAIWRQYSTHLLMQKKSKKKTKDPRLMPRCNRGLGQLASGPHVGDRVIAKLPIVSNARMPNTCDDSGSDRKAPR